MSLLKEIFSLATPALAKRSVTWSSTPQVIGLMKPSGGGGVNDELIFSTCATKVGSFGIQLPITMRPPGFVTRTISLATSKGLGANMAPKMEIVKSNEWSSTPCKLHRVSYHEFQIVELRLRRSPVSGFNKIFGYVDTHNFSSQSGHRNCRRTISASEVQYPNRRF